MTLIRALPDDDYWRKDDNAGLAVQDLLDNEYWRGIGARLGQEDTGGAPWILPAGVEEPRMPPWSGSEGAGRSPAAGTGGCAGCRMPVR